MPKRPRAGWEWCITNAQRELLKVGREYPFDGKRYRCFVANQIALFRVSTDWQTTHQNYVRRFLKKHPLVKLPYWQAASSILVDAIWDTFWKEVLIPEAENQSQVAA